MGFYYSNQYYGFPIGVKIRGTIGKKYTYQLNHNKQVKYIYRKPDNPRTVPQQANRDKIRQAVIAWKTLNPTQKALYRSFEPFKPPMSGYNYFIQLYLLNKV